MTPNTPMTELSEKVAEILAGLEGVTPGPWEADKWGDGSSGGDWIICAPAIEAVLAPTVRFADDAAHIARCDPDTMRQILTLAKQALRQSDTRIEGGGEPVAWVTADILAAMKRGDRAVPGWKRSEEFCIPLYATPPVNKSPNPETVGSIYGEFTPISINAPTPEHVEGDVLSVGELGEDPNKLAAELLEYAERCSDPTNETLRAAAAYISAATTRIQRAEAYREELMKLAAELGEPDDPFAAWEALAALKAQLGGTNG